MFWKTAIWICFILGLWSHQCLKQRCQLWITCNNKSQWRTMYRLLNDWNIDLSCVRLSLIQLICALKYAHTSTATLNSSDMKRWTSIGKQNTCNWSHQQITTQISYSVFDICLLLCLYVYHLIVNKVKSKQRVHEQSHAHLRALFLCLPFLFCSAVLSLALSLLVPVFLFGGNCG